MSSNLSSNRLNLQRFNSAPVQKKNEIHILTPDDDNFALLSVEMMLKEVQNEHPEDTFKIHKAKDDIEAATILQEQHDKNEDIDFIWSDNDMRPGGNQGLLLLNRVNSATSQERARPLLAMNSATSMPDRLRAAAGSLGAQFFSKPVKKKELSTFYAANRNEILLRKAHKSGSSFNMSNPPNELPAEVQALLDKKNELLAENLQLEESNKKMAEQIQLKKQQLAQLHQVPKARDSNRPDHPAPQQTELDSPKHAQGCCTGNKFCDIF